MREKCAAICEGGWKNSLSGRRRAKFSQSKTNTNTNPMTTSPPAYQGRGENPIPAPRRSQLPPIPNRF